MRELAGLFHSHAWRTHVYYPILNHLSKYQSIKFVSINYSRWFSCSNYIELEYVMLYLKYFKCGLSHPNSGTKIEARKRDR